VGELQLRRFVLGNRRPHSAAWRARRRRRPHRLRRRLDLQRPPGVRGLGLVSLAALGGRAGGLLALAGPAAVDSVYQLYFDGALLGGEGDFSRPTPSIYSIQPRKFTAGLRSGCLAFRVWMPGPAPAGAGGIHIAPKLGESSAIDLAIQAQWLQTFEGYVVEVLLPAIFALLAALALIVGRFEGRTPWWLILALACSGLSRLNQAVYFWAQVENLRAYDLIRNVVLTPLSLFAWAMTFIEWFELRKPLKLAALILTVLLTLAVVATRSWLLNLHSVVPMINGVRWVYAALFVFIGVLGARRHALATVALVFAFASQFPAELSAFGLKGIWFPFGVGVSRTQYAYALLSVVLFAVLLRRLLRFAPT
jgi:hypothetical protein